MSNKGAPRVIISEQNKAQTFPGFRGGSVGVVIDSERGSVDHYTTQSSPETLLAAYGSPNPLKYGISMYSALNAVQKCSNVKVIRVDRGQLYGSVLVRAKIAPQRDVDEFGFNLEKPVVDPIVKPNGSLTKGEVEAFVFPKYERKRETASFSPVISLTDKPVVGDNKLYVDNVAPIKVGQQITLKDVTGLDQEAYGAYNLYTVTATEKKQVSQEFIDIDKDLISVAYDTVVHKVDLLPEPFIGETKLEAPAKAKATQITVGAATSAVQGDKFKVQGVPTIHTISAVEAAEIAVSNYEAGTTTKQGDDVVRLSKAAPEIKEGMVVKIGENPTMTVKAVDVQTDHTDITMTENVPSVLQDGAVQIVRMGKNLTFAPALTHSLPLNEVLQKVSGVVNPYSSQVLAKEVVAGNLRRIRVSNNDPVAEGDMVRINGVDYTVSAKITLDNFVNEVTIAEEYQSQTTDNIGAEVFNVVKGDTEYRDAFMVYPKDPGAFSKNIAVAVRPHSNYEDAFVLEVYENGKKVKEHEVSRKHRFNGYGQQMFIEDVVNNQSQHIRVKDNPHMVDENGEPVMPLFTTHYVRQKEPKKIFTKFGVTTETLRDEDNLIRVAPEVIEKVNINAKLKVGNYEYVISALRASSTGNAVDTIVLESGLKLDMEALPKAARFLPVGTELYQQVDYQQTENFNIVEVTEGQVYAITLNGIEVSYTAQRGDTESTVLTALAQKVEESAAGVVVAASVKTLLAETWMEIKAQTPGHPFHTTHSANMEKETAQENVRRWEHAKPERVQNAIVPNLETDKLVNMTEGKFYIRDAGANRFSGGFDGALPTVGQFIRAARKAFSNKESVDVIALVDGGVAYPAYQKALDEIASKRTDCMTFLSVSYDAQANPDVMLGPVKYRRDLALDSSYSSLYSSWIQVYDPYNDFPVWVSPESDAAGTFALNGEIGELWHPVAGWANGKLNRALVVGQEYTEAERGVLYDNGINPIKVDAKGRRAIFGQKTLQIENSPTNRINVRASLIVISRSLTAYLEDQLFTVNDANNRRRHKLNADSFMENLKRRGYVYDFYTQCDENNNDAQVISEAELYIDVFVKVSRLVEYAHGRVTLTAQGASFELVK